MFCSTRTEIRLSESQVRVGWSVLYGRVQFTAHLTKREIAREQERRGEESRGDQEERWRLISKQKSSTNLGTKYIHTHCRGFDLYYQVVWIPITVIYDEKSLSLSVLVVVVVLVYMETTGSTKGSAVPVSTL